MIENYRYAVFSAEAYRDDLTSIKHETIFHRCEETDTEFYILKNDVEQIVIFRGTETGIENWQDIKTDLNFKANSKKIHNGFYKAYESVKSVMLKNLDRTKFTVFTGHSLGGALAQVAGFYWSGSEEFKTVTFGSPKVFKGLKRFERNYRFESGLINYQNDCDPVTALPPRFDQLGHVIYMDYSNSYANRPFWAGLKMLLRGIKYCINQHDKTLYISRLGRGY